MAILLRSHAVPRVMRAKKPMFNSRAAASIKPHSTSIPAAPNFAMPCPATRGLGSCTATATRATPEFDPAGAALVFSTYVGSQQAVAFALALEPDGSAVLAGSNALY